MNQLSAANVPEVPPSISEYTVQRAATAEHAPAPAGDFGSLLFISPPLHRKFIPACLMSGDLWKRFFKAVRSCHKSRRYLRWNARQNISVNCYPVTSKSFAPFSETKKRCPSRAEARWGHRALHIKGTNTMTLGKPCRSSLLADVFRLFYK